MSFQWVGQIKKWKGGALHSFLTEDGKWSNEFLEAATFTEAEAEAKIRELGFDPEAKSNRSPKFSMSGYRE